MRKKTNPTEMSTKRIVKMHYEERALIREELELQGIPCVKGKRSLVNMEFTQGNLSIFFDNDFNNNKYYGIIVRDGDTLCRHVLETRDCYKDFIRDIRKAIRYPMWKGTKHGH